MNGEPEYRLWDTQWMNIVNHAFGYRDFTKEEAVVLAVKLTEQAFAKNFTDSVWPPKREPVKEQAP